MKNQTEKNILIVDDEPGTIKIIADYFQEAKLPYNIIRTPNGMIALDIIKKHCPDLIITDWDMPEMSGIELIKELKKDKQYCNIPVIMCTGVMTTSENLDTALDAGAIDYIRKPVDKLELFARTRSALVLADSQQRVIQQNKELSELNSTKDKLFSIIGHDLRNPISTVMGMIQVLKEKYNNYSSERIEEFLNLMFEGAESGFKLLENLLEWSRFQIGKTKYNPTDFSLKSIVDINLSLLAPNAAVKNIELSTNIKEHIGIHGDENMINTVIRNLISNAIKFTPEGGKVSVNYAPHPEGVLIKVEDTGIGIKEENINRLFNLDINFTTYGTNEEKGTGLGLCLCYEFIQLHSSEIKVVSEVGKGSEFSFVLAESKF